MALILGLPGVQTNEPIAIPALQAWADLARFSDEASLLRTGAVLEGYQLFSQVTLLSAAPCIAPRRQRMIPLCF